MHEAMATAFHHSSVATADCRLDISRLQKTKQTAYDSGTGGHSYFNTCCQRVNPGCVLSEKDMSDGLHQCRVHAPVYLLPTNARLIFLLLSIHFLFLSLALPFMDSRASRIQASSPQHHNRTGRHVTCPATAS